MTENKSPIKEYVIPLREKVRVVPRYKKTNKAVRTVKEFLARHMKIYDRDLNKIKIDRYLNEFLWGRGIRHPPHKVKVKAYLKDGNVIAELVDFPNKLKFKKLREEKMEIKTKEILEKKKSVLAKAKDKIQGSEKEISEDKNKDGVEDKKEFEEKKAAVVEAGEQMEKQEAKKKKHSTKALSPKQEKNKRVGYDKTSRGH